MRSATTAILLLIGLGMALPALAAKLVDAPPPPLIPDAELEKDGTPKQPVLIEQPSRGQLLYENHCMGCHESVANIRNRKQVRTPAALREEIARWAANTGLRWGKDEIEDVARHLDSRHYRFQP